LRPEHVLLVDDNELLLSGMKRFFEKDFFNVTASRSGEEALVNLRQRVYDIIILDINLPGINGWEVLEFITEKSPSSRVIIITSDDDGGMRQEALRRGACEGMGKPFDLDELKNVLINVLYRQREKRIQRTFEVRFNGGSRGFVHNLSPTGMFIVTNVLLESGTMLELELKIPGEESILLKGKVIRTVESVAEDLPDMTNLPGELNYGLGIKLMEQPLGYSALTTSLLL
jgi:CheY-like chemotaxis protein